MRKGFTLVEILLATAIGAVVAVVAVSSLQMIVHGREKALGYSELNDKARYASETMRNDLRNLYRDTEKSSLLECQFVEGDESGFPHLRFYSVSMVKARTLEPESDVYEVHYFVKSDEETGKQILMRRYCPAVAGVEVDEENSPGGILMPLLVGVSDFRVRLFDGNQWQEQWVVEDGSLPVLVEIGVGCYDEKVKKTLNRNFTVSFFRNSNVSQNQLSDEDEESQVEDESLLDNNANERGGAESD